MGVPQRRVVISFKISIFALVNTTVAEEDFDNPKL